VRDATVIALAWATGLRRSELAGLTRADYVRTGADEGDLTVRGKGDKVRAVYVYDGAAAYLADWLACAGTAPGRSSGPSTRAGWLQAGHGVSAEALAQMLEKRRGEAGLRPLTWHDFRRTFAGNLLDNGMTW
jgi:site-specific recombinase XerD